MIGNLIVLGSVSVKSFVTPKPTLVLLLRCVDGKLYDISGENLFTVVGTPTEYFVQSNVFLYAV